MGKTRGFLEHNRKNAPYRPVSERIKDYKEVNTYLSENEIKEQASRCMNCGVPFCHCIGCPVNNLIPEWNDLVYKGKWERALRRLERTNAMPEITGRICPAPCETSCTLSINDSPVTIRQIELSIIEYGFKHGLVKPLKPTHQINKKIAVIGSGPAGLSAAQILRGKGYKVTVFEKSEKPGGILRYGIPDFKLEKRVLDRRIDLLKESGIKFETSVNIGEDISYQYLKNKFTVILLTTGAGKPRDLPVPGRELHGIHFAMDYLSGSNRYVAGDVEKKSTISAKGKTVLVIGGGDTGSDCIGTANRQGAKKIYQFEIMPKPKDWNETWNPVWPEWPVILRTYSSHEEGAQREWAVLTKKFTGKDNRVAEIHCTRVEWKTKEQDNRPVMAEIPNSDFKLEIDLVLLAMGFVHTEHKGLVKQLKLELDSRGNVKTNENFMTSREKVFSAGDMRRGQSLIVWAISEGKKAADKIDDLLAGKK